jgi:tetratricopeptide (TPR) repeat protein/O-antigen ligase
MSAPFSGRVSLRLGLVPGAMAAALALQSLSIPLALNPLEGLVELVNRVLWIGAAVLGLHLLRVRRELHAVLWAGSAGAAVAALVGIAQTTGWTSDLLPQVAVPASIFGNKNMGAEYILLWVPLALYLSLGAEPPVARILGAGVTGVTSAYVFLTGTRAAYVAGAIALGALAVCIAWVLATSAPRDARRLVFRGLASALVVVVTWGAVAVYIAVVKQMVPDGQRRHVMSEANAAMTLASYSTNWRLVVWANTLAMARDNILLGVGLSNWKYHYPRYHRKVAIDTDFNSRVQADTPHNDYFQALAESGLAGTLGFAAFALVLAVSCALALAPGRAIEDRLACAGIAGAIVAYAVDAAFSFPASKAAPTFVLFVLIGAVSGLGRRCGAWATSDFSAVQAASLAPALLFIGVTAAQVCWAVGDVRFKEGLILYNAGRPLEAYEKLKAGYRFRPFDPSLGVFYGGIAQETNHVDEALEINLRAREQHPHFTNVLNQLGNIYWRKGQKKEAEEAYREVLSIHPEFTEALRNLASLYIEQARFPDARTLLEKLVALESGDPAHQLDLGEVYRALRKRERARETLVGLLKRWPDNARAHVALAHLTREEKRFADAERLYRRALELDAKLTQAHFFLGTLLFEMARPADGRRELAEALALEPGNAQVRDAFRRLVRSPTATAPTPTAPAARAVDETEDSLRAELARDPRSVGLLRALAQLYLDSGRLDEARPQLERIAEIDPKDTMAWGKLGKTHEARGAWARALSTYQRALEHDPDNPIMLNELGLAFQTLGRDGDALAAFEHAARSASVPTQVWYNLGRHRERAGRPAEALDAFRRFVSAWKPNDDHRKKALDAIRRLEAAPAAPAGGPPPER